MRLFKALLASAIIASVIAISTHHYQSRPYVVEFSPGELTGRM